MRGYEGARASPRTAIAPARREIGERGSAAGGMSAAFVVPRLAPMVAAGGAGSILAPRSEGREPGAGWAAQGATDRCFRVARLRVIALSGDRDGASADADAGGGAGWDLDLQKTRAPEVVTLMDRDPGGWRDEAKLA